MYERMEELFKPSEREPNKLRKRRPDKPPQSPSPSPSPAADDDDGESTKLAKARRRVSGWVGNALQGSRLSRRGAEEVSLAPPAAERTPTADCDRPEGEDQNPRSEAREGQVHDGPYAAAMPDQITAAAIPQDQEDRKRWTVHNPDPAPVIPRPTAPRQPSQKSLDQWMRDRKAVSDSDFIPALDDETTNGVPPAYAQSPIPLFRRARRDERRSTGSREQGSSRQHRHSHISEQPWQTPPSSAVTTLEAEVLETWPEHLHDVGTGVYGSQHLSIASQVGDGVRWTSVFQSEANTQQQQPWPLPDYAATYGEPSSTPTRLSASRTNSIAAGEALAQEPEKYVPYRPPPASQSTLDTPTSASTALEETVTYTGQTSYTGHARESAGLTARTNTADQMFLSEALPYDTTPQTSELVQEATRHTHRPMEVIDMTEQPFGRRRTGIRSLAELNERYATPRGFRVPATFEQEYVERAEGPIAPPQTAHENDAAADSAPGRSESADSGIIGIEHHHADDNPCLFQQRRSSISPSPSPSGSAYSREVDGTLRIASLGRPEAASGYLADDEGDAALSAGGGLWDRKANLPLGRGPFAPQEHIGRRRREVVPLWEKRLHTPKKMPAQRTLLMGLWCSSPIVQYSGGISKTLHSIAA